MENVFKIDAEILAIDNARPMKEGSTMMIQDFIVSKPNPGESNDLKFSCKGNNCSLLDKFEIGDNVVITFSLMGTYGGAKTKEGNIASRRNPNAISTFSPNLICFKIDFAPGFVRQVNANPNVAYSPKPNQPTQNQTQQQAGAPAVEVDDLPF